MSKEKFKLREYINSEEFENDFKQLLDFEKVGSTEKVIVECKTAILNYDSLDILEAIFENKGLNINLEKLSEKNQDDLRIRVQHRINHIFSKEENDLNINSQKEEYIELFKNIGFVEYTISEKQKIFIDHKNKLLINLIEEEEFKCLLLANGSLRKHIKEEDKLVEVLGNTLNGLDIDYICVDLKELPYFKIQKTIEMYNCTKLYHIEKEDLLFNENFENILNKYESLRTYFNSSVNMHNTENIQKNTDFLSNLSLEEKEDILYRMSIFINTSNNRLLFNNNLLEKIIENNIDINLFKIALNVLKEENNTTINSFENYKKVIVSFNELELKELKERTIDEKYLNLSEKEKNELDLFIKNNERIINVTQKIVH